MNDYEIRVIGNKHGHKWLEDGFIVDIQMLFVSEKLAAVGLATILGFFLGLGIGALL